MTTTGTFDSTAAKEASLDHILKILKDRGATRVFVKKLAPNDNSKNQPYFGSHLTNLPFIPTGDLTPSLSQSGKTSDPRRRIKYQAELNLSWFDTVGNLYPAPHAKLVYYPQYPEVRFSGFLKGSKVQASEWMSVEKQGRSLGRWLILGVCPDKNVLSYLAVPESRLSRELEETALTEISEIFGQIDATGTAVASTREALMKKLAEIHNMGWIPSQKLNSDMEATPYKAPNGGGYTLEAQLGVLPNNYSEPDYLGWEVKQFGVTEFPAKGAKPTTLMTPEPDGGLYADEGATAFVRKYGYPDKSGKPDRLNFGGRHFTGITHKTTGLTLHLLGFDTKKAAMTDADGSSALIDDAGAVAASWGFPKLMNHWKRKHSQAVYIPCQRRSSKHTGGHEYHYGKDIELGTGTNFEILLASLAAGYICYDPGIKLENSLNPKASAKRRNQFRINHKYLNTLYQDYMFVDVRDRTETH